MSLSGQTGIVYSTVKDRQFQSELFREEGVWQGRSFYIEEGQAFIRDGLIYQTLKGINENEIWLLKCLGQDLKGKLRLSFINDQNSLISTKTKEIQSKEKHYFSNYCTALASANKLLGRFEGEGILERFGVSQLKPKAVLTDWKGILGRKDDKEFGQGNIGRKFFRGRAENVRTLEDIDFSTFQGRRKIFLGFLENKSVVERVEGCIEQFSPKLSHKMNGPVDFRCSPAKLILNNWD